MTAALLVVGLVLLVMGAELVVRGASSLALSLRIPPLVVGLTVVAFGTSAPELAVSTSAVLSGNGDLAVGNVVGSNIFNVLLILGLSALVAPLRVSTQLVRLDVPVMIGVSFLLLMMAWNGSVTRLEGMLLLVGLVIYLGYLFRSGRSLTSGAAAGGSADAVPPSGRPFAVVRDLALVVAGLFLLVLGSRWLVESAREIALSLGVSELMIGLTVVAAGTSMPELATSVIAAARGQREIAVGNAIGSNIFNVLAVVGVAATLAPAGLAASPAAVTFDIPVMTVVAVLCLPVFFSGGTISRWEGALFAGYYVAYTAYLALDATDHDALPRFRDAMVYFVVPLTALTVVMVALRACRRGRDEST